MGVFVHFMPLLPYCNID